MIVLAVGITLIAVGGIVNDSIIVNIMIDTQLYH